MYSKLTTLYLQNAVCFYINRDIFNTLIPDVESSAAARQETVISHQFTEKWVMYTSTATRIVPKIHSRLERTRWQGKLISESNLIH